MIAINRRMIGVFVSLLIFFSDASAYYRSHSVFSNVLDKCGRIGVAGIKKRIEKNYPCEKMLSEIVKDNLSLEERKTFFKVLTKLSYSYTTFEQLISLGQENFHLMKALIDEQRLYDPDFFKELVEYTLYVRNREITPLLLKGYLHFRLSKINSSELEEKVITALYTSKDWEGTERLITSAKYFTPDNWLKKFVHQMNTNRNYARFPIIFLNERNSPVSKWKDYLKGKKIVISASFNCGFSNFLIEEIKNKFPDFSRFSKDILFLFSYDDLPTLSDLIDFRRKLPQANLGLVNNISSMPSEIKLHEFPTINYLKDSKILFISDEWEIDIIKSEIIKFLTLNTYLPKNLNSNMFPGIK